MHAVEVAEAGKEAPALDRKTVRQCGSAEERLFDADRVIAMDGCGYVAEEKRIHIGRNGQLGFTKIKTAGAGTGVSATGHKADNAIIGGVTRQIAVGTRQYQRQGRIERVGAATGRRGRRQGRRNPRRLAASRGGNGFQLCYALFELLDTQCIRCFEGFQLSVQIAERVGEHGRGHGKEQRRQSARGCNSQKFHDNGPLNSQKTPGAMAPVPGANQRGLGGARLR